MVKDANILTIENFIPLSQKSILKLYFYDNRNNQII